MWLLSLEFTHPLLQTPAPRHATSLPHALPSSARARAGSNGGEAAFVPPTLRLSLSPCSQSCFSAMPALREQQALTTCAALLRV